MSSLTASLQAQAQSLALRTQQLSDRTAAVSGYSQAITEMLRSANANTLSSNASSSGGSSNNSVEGSSEGTALTAQSIREARLRIQQLSQSLNSVMERSSIDGNEMEAMEEDGLTGTLPTQGCSIILMILSAHSLTLS